MNDQFNGEGGDFEMVNGQRVRAGQPQQRHPEGDAPREANGQVIAHVQTETEPALPAPADNE